MEASKSWDAYVFDALAAMIATKPALVYVNSCDDFTFPEINARIWSRKGTKSTYFLAYSSEWHEDDIKELSSTMEFDSAALWFEIVRDPFDESQIDERSFFATALQVARGEEHIDANIECIGKVCDGEEIIWMNPNLDHVHQVLPQLESSCELMDLEWRLLDERNNNLRQ